MKVFLTGIKVIPKVLKKSTELDIQIVENAYSLRDLATQTTTTSILLVYLPFIETRHFDLYSHLQRAYPQLLIAFVVNELSGSMKLKLKHNKEFLVFWKTEENNLAENLKTALKGRHLQLRQDRREEQHTRNLLSPAQLPTGRINGFKPMLPGAFENLSENGSCVKIQAQYYEPKDFVRLSYQNKQGDFITVQGQVRWSKWNPTEQTQELGLHFVSSV